MAHHLHQRCLTKLRQYKSRLLWLTWELAACVRNDDARQFGGGPDVDGIRQTDSTIERAAFYARLGIMFARHVPKAGATCWAKCPMLVIASTNPCVCPR